MKFFREVKLGKFALRFYPADSGWVCGTTKETLDGLDDQEFETYFAPLDPTPAMKTAAVNVALFDHDTGHDYTLSWEEAEEIYSAMMRAIEEK